MTRWQKMTQEQKESANERRRLWKLKNPEKAKALGRRLAARHYYKNISESRRKNRESQARQRLLNPEKFRLKAREKYKNLSQEQKFNLRQISKNKLNSIRAFIDKYKMQRGCIDCGYKKHPSALHFDHVKGVKEFNISGMRTFNLQKIVNEINKCEVRCANCHAVRTWAHKLPEREKE